MVSIMSVGNIAVGMEPQAEGSEVTCFSRSGELKVNGTSAGLSQISCKKKIPIPRGMSKHMGVCFEK